jgi:ATP-binding cassette subfamily C protein
MMILLGLASALFLRTIRRKLTSLGEDEHRFRKLMMRNASQGLGGLKDLKVLGREAYFVRSFVASAWSYTRAGVYRATIFELPRLFLETIAVMTMLGVAALLIYQKRPMQDIVPVLTLLAIAAVRLMPSTNRIVSAIVGIRYGIPALDAIHKDFQSESQELPSDAIEERSGPQFEHAIEFVDVRFRYANSIRDSLRGVSVRIEKGSAVAVIGASGAGKTTLVDVLLGLLKPTSGSVRVDGRDIHENLGHWQRQIGYIPQHVFLADDTIRRNIAFGVADEQIDDERIKTVLESAQLRDFVGTLPAGVDTEIGERGARLSGGQRQRIGIARALYHDPPILVMDEATSALDHKTESLIVEVLEQLRGGRTMIVIAHRHSTVQHFENVLLIEDGRIKAQGKLREVIAAGA